MPLLTERVIQVGQGYKHLAPPEQDARTPKVEFLSKASCRNGHQTLAKVSNQNHIARLCDSRNGELTVAREVEPENLVGLEVGQLFRWPAVQRQRPDIRDAVN